VDGSEEDWLEYSYYTFPRGKNPYFSDANTCIGHAADDPVLPQQYDLPYTAGLTK
jgi:hypothetical protein